MSRPHIHFVVDDLAAGVRFYSRMSAGKPAVNMSGYAEWLLDDPRVAFAISRRGVTPSMIQATSIRIPAMPQPACGSLGRSPICIIHRTITRT